MKLLNQLVEGDESVFIDYFNKNKEDIKYVDESGLDAVVISVEDITQDSYGNTPKPSVPTNPTEIKDVQVEEEVPVQPKTDATDGDGWSAYSNTKKEMLNNIFNNDPQGILYEPEIVTSPIEAPIEAPIEEDDKGEAPIEEDDKGEAPKISISDYVSRVAPKSSVPTGSEIDGVQIEEDNTPSIEQESFEIEYNSIPNKMFGDMAVAYDKEKNTLYMGSIGNSGVYRDVEVDIDYDLGLQYNLEQLVDQYYEEYGDAE